LINFVSENPRPEFQHLESFRAFGPFSMIAGYWTGMANPPPVHGLPSHSAVLSFPTSRGKNGSGEGGFLAPIKTRRLALLTAMIVNSSELLSHPAKVPSIISTAF